MKETLMKLKVIDNAGFYVGTIVPKVGMVFFMRMLKKF